MHESTSIPIALADHHAVVRTAVTQWLAGAGGYVLTACTRNGEELVTACEDGAPMDLAVVHLDLPVLDGYATLAWFREHRPEVRMLALHTDGSDAALHRALRLGARAVLPITVTEGAFLQAVQEVQATGHHHDARVLRLLQATEATALDAMIRARRLLATLTRRERQFLRLFCGRGLPALAVVAQRMGVQPHTAETFRKNVVRKTGEHSQAELLLFALRCGLVAL